MKTRFHWSHRDVFLSYLVYRGVKSDQDFLDRVDEYGQDWTTKKESLRRKIMNFNALDGANDKWDNNCNTGRDIYDSFKSFTDSQLLLIWDHFQNYL